MRVAPTITLTEDERLELTKLVRSKLTSVRLAQRAQIVLLASTGKQTIAIVRIPVNVTGITANVTVGRCCAV